MFLNYYFYRNYVYVSFYYTAALTKLDGAYYGMVLSVCLSVTSFLNVRKRLFLRNYKLSCNETLRICWALSTFCVITFSKTSDYWKGLFLWNSINFEEKNEWSDLDENLFAISLYEWQYIFIFLQSEWKKKSNSLSVGIFCCNLNPDIWIWIHKKNNFLPSWLWN